MPNNINPPVHTEFSMPLPGAAPLNLTQLFTLANSLVHSEIVGSYLPYVVKNGTPDVDDQDKVWFQLDSQGRPIAIKVFWQGSGPNGAWRRVYNGMLGEIRAYHGAPGYGPAPALFNTNGMGNSGLEYDGWHICNGKDGTPDLSDKFLLGAHMNKTDSKNDYEDGEWVSWIDKKAAKATGGAIDFTSTADNTYQKARPELWSGRWFASGNARSDTGQMFGDPHLISGPGSPPDPSNTENRLIYAGDDGNATPDPVSIINPFIALGWIIFVGY
jgi:hypothetical protein